MKSLSAPAFYRHLREKFPHTPTPKQTEALKALSDFITRGDTREVFLLKGYAGTGKTTLLGTLVTNLWHRDPKQTAAAQGAIADAFDGRLLQLDVQSGNRIVYAFAGELPRPRRQTLFEQAQGLSQALGIPARRLVRNLWHQNAPTLRLGRLEAG